MEPPDPFPMHKAKLDRTHPQRIVGCELEIAGAAAVGCAVLQRILRKWGGGSVRDGSLPSGGFEVVTAPAAGKLFRQQIKEVTTALEEMKAGVTADCGFHLHVDGRDLFYEDLRRLLLIYSAVEAALLFVVSPSRRDNQYCVPCGQTYYEIARAGKQQSAAKARRPAGRHALTHRLYGGRSDRAAAPYHFRTGKGKPDKYAARGSEGDQMRYMALNLASWYHRGTIEVRLHQGTMDYDKIVNWACLWSNIVSLAQRMSDRECDAWLAAGGSNLTPEGKLQRLLTLAPSREVQDYLLSRYNTFATREHRAPVQIAPPPVVQVNPGRRRASRR